MHPRRGILILEVKAFRRSTLIQANKQTWDIHGELAHAIEPQRVVCQHEMGNTC